MNRLGYLNRTLSSAEVLNIISPFSCRTGICPVISFFNTSPHWGVASWNEISARTLFWVKTKQWNFQNSQKNCTGFSAVKFRDFVSLTWANKNCLIKFKFSCLFTQKSWILGSLILYSIIIVVSIRKHLNSRPLQIYKS